MPAYKTLQELLDRDDRYDINKITYFTHTDDGELIISDYNLIDKYMRYIAPYIVTYTMTPAQRAFYKYRPYQMSYDVYGTMDLAMMIMILNDRECASKFYLKRTVKLIPPDKIGPMYESIITKASAKL